MDKITPKQNEHTIYVFPINALLEDMSKDLQLFKHFTTFWVVILLQRVISPVSFGGQLSISQNNVSIKC